MAQYSYPRQRRRMSMIDMATWLLVLIAFAWLGWVMVTTGFLSIAPLDSPGAASVPTARIAPQPIPLHEQVPPAAPVAPAPIQIVDPLLDEKAAPPPVQPTGVDVISDPIIPAADLPPPPSRVQSAAPVMSGRISSGDAPAASNSAQSVAPAASGPPDTGLHRRPLTFGGNTSKVKP